MRVLVGDVGGTNSRIAVLETDGFEILEEQVYPSDRHDGLGSVLAQFLSEADAPFEAACFGLAGPVADGRVETTNLPWVVDERNLADELGVPVALINDLEAAAWSLDVLADDEVNLIYPGRPEDVPISGNRALISAGTGLGQAGLFWDGDQHRPFATEGGHTDFAPTDDFEWELREGLFVESFLSKGRMRHVLEPVPVHVILFEGTALRGAARFAAGEAGRAGHRPGRKEYQRAIQHSAREVER